MTKDLHHHAEAAARGGRQLPLPRYAENSYSYFYYSTIVSLGWAALSTDSSEGFVYLEANHCTVKTIKAGYGTYADGGCHNVLNDCTFDVADMACIIAGEADMHLHHTKAKCGSYFALIHSVMGSPPRRAR